MFLTTYQTNSTTHFSVSITLFISFQSSFTEKSIIYEFVKYNYTIIKQTTGEKNTDIEFKFEGGASGGVMKPCTLRFDQVCKEVKCAMKEMGKNYEIINTNAKFKYQLQTGGQIFIVNMRETSEADLLTILRKFYEDLMNFLIFYPIQNGSVVSELPEA